MAIQQGIVRNVIESHNKIFIGQNVSKCIFVQKHDKKGRHFVSPNKVNEEDEKKQHPDS